MRSLILTAALLATPVLAAAPALHAQRAAPTAADSAVLRALDLPRIMQRARTAGIPDSSLRVLIDAMRRRGIPAEDAAAAAESELETVERGGKKEEFGSYVRAQVDAGYRGRELADRIHAEQRRRGMGPEKANRSDDRPERGRRSSSDSSRGKSSAAQGRRP